MSGTLKKSLICWESINNKCPNEAEDYLTLNSK